MARGLLAEGESKDSLFAPPVAAPKTAEVSMLTVSPARAEELKAQSIARMKALGFREPRPLLKKEGAQDETLLDQVKRNFAGMAGPAGGSLGAASAATSVAQSSIQNISYQIGHYNWAMWELSPERLEVARNKLSPEDYEEHVQKWRDTAENHGSALQTLQKQMEEVWQVSGNLFEEQPDGKLRLGQFSMTFAGDNYAARVDSRGLAEVSTHGGAFTADNLRNDRPVSAKGSSRPVQLDISV